MAAVEPLRLEQFVVLEAIGEGSFGRVYKGRRRYEGSIVALKFIRKHGKSAKDIRSLRQEIAILRGLTHESIITMLDAFETASDEFCVVTEYAHGDLYQILENDVCLPEHVVRSIASQLVAALGYLHAHRIIHRDLKPQNVLVAADGRIKLCDFGFARAMSATTLVLTSIKGTPLYMAPELVQELPYTHAVDLWSLGVILYELLVGKPPFYTTNIYALVALIVNEPLGFPAQLALSPPVESLLRGLLTKDPAARLNWPALACHAALSQHVSVYPSGSDAAKLGADASLSASLADIRAAVAAATDSATALADVLGDIARSRLVAAALQADAESAASAMAVVTCLARHASHWSRATAAAAQHPLAPATVLAVLARLAEARLADCAGAGATGAAGEPGAAVAAAESVLGLALRVAAALGRPSVRLCQVLARALAMQALFSKFSEETRLALLRCLHGAACAPDSAAAGSEAVEASSVAEAAKTTAKTTLVLMMTDDSRAEPLDVLDACAAHEGVLATLFAELSELRGADDAVAVAALRLLSLLAICRSAPRAPPPLVGTCALAAAIPRLGLAQALADLLGQLPHGFHAVCRALALPGALATAAARVLVVAAGLCAKLARVLALRADVAAACIVPQLSLTATPAQAALAMRLAAQAVAGAPAGAALPDWLAALAVRLPRDVGLGAAALAAAPAAVAGAWALLAAALLRVPLLAAELASALLLADVDGCALRALENVAAQAAATTTGAGERVGNTGAGATPAGLADEFGECEGAGGGGGCGECAYDAPGDGWVALLYRLVSAGGAPVLNRLVRAGLVPRLGALLLPPAGCTLGALSPVHAVSAARLLCSAVASDMHVCEAAALALALPAALRLLAAPHVARVRAWPPPCGGGASVAELTVFHALALLQAPLACEAAASAASGGGGGGDDSPTSRLVEAYAAAGVLDVAVPALAALPVELCEAPLNLIARLALALPSQAARLAALGGLEPGLVRRLRGAGAPGVLVDLLMIVSQLARLGGEHYAGIQAAGGLALVLQGLAHGDVDVRAKAANLAGNLCRHSGFFYDELVSSGAAAALVAACSDVGGDVRKFACFAVGNACFHSAAAYGALASAIEPLLRLLRDAEPKTRANAAGAIGNLARNSSALLEPMLAAGAVRALVACVQTDSDAAPRRIALFSLGNLCSYGAGREAVLGALGDAAWLRALAASQEDATMRQYAARVLAKLDGK